uniref:Uncharacterized protein n=1 Tax=Lepeophtheirus salmonis TaxID=72036 RepID=A0A0K2UVD9_LEPSM
MDTEHDYLKPRRNTKNPVHDDSGPERPQVG